MIFLSELVETAVVNTKAKRTIFLFDEEDRSSMQGQGWANETGTEVFVDEFS